MCMYLKCIQTAYIAYTAEHIVTISMWKLEDISARNEPGKSRRLYVPRFIIRHQEQNKQRKCSSRPDTFILLAVMTSST